jgi:hypothetical protein
MYGFLSGELGLLWIDIRRFDGFPPMLEHRWRVQKVAQIVDVISGYAAFREDIAPPSSPAGDPIPFLPFDIPK